MAFVAAQIFLITWIALSYQCLVFLGHQNHHSCNHRREGALVWLMDGSSHGAGGGARGGAEGKKELTSGSGASGAEPPGSGDMGGCLRIAITKGTRGGQCAAAAGRLGNKKMPIFMVESKGQQH